MNITIEVIVKAHIDKVWQAWNTPEDIKQWNAASEDWHTTASSVDLREGGSFNSRMEAKDGSMGFDFFGTYTLIKEKERIEYTLGDNRLVSISFSVVNNGVKITESFQTEDENSAERQKEGWQNILNNFARYVEGKA